MSRDRLVLPVDAILFDARERSFVLKRRHRCTMTETAHQPSC
jgi:hypothetical protein